MLFHHWNHRTEGEKEEEGFILPSEVLAKTMWDNRAASSALLLRQTGVDPECSLLRCPPASLGTEQLSPHIATLESWRGTTASTYC